MGLVSLDFLHQTQEFFDGQRLVRHNSVHSTPERRTVSSPRCGPPLARRDPGHVRWAFLSLTLVSARPNIVSRIHRRLHMAGTDGGFLALLLAMGVVLY